MIRVIPAIDIIGGRCVRLSQGDFDRTTVYSASPSEMAGQFAECGFGLIHAVDLDGAKAGRPVNIETLRLLSESGVERIEWGGGIKSREDIKTVLEAGASRVVCGTMAVKDPGLFRECLEEFGTDRIVLGADVRGAKVAVSGWLETSGKDIQDLVGEFLPTLSQVIVTDISRDGMLTGANVGLYRDLIKLFPTVTFTASGGIGTVDDIKALEDARVEAVIVGKALYEGRIKLEDLQRWSRKG